MRALGPTGMWKGYSPGQRLFAKNLLVGILIAAAVNRWHDVTLVTGLQDSAMDTMMQINKNLPRMRPAILGGKPIEFTFLDIDEQTYRTWGEPLLTPRDKLQKLIQFATEGQAAVVVVDVDLSRRGNNAEHDEALARFLQQQSQQKESTAVILMRSFYPVAGRGSTNIAGDIRPSYLDQYLDWTAISWAQPLFKLTLSDGIVRYWQTIATGCLNGRPVVVPSSQLATLIALLEWRRDPIGAEAARSALSASTPASCDNPALPGNGADQSVVFGPHRIRLGYPVGVSERIIYTISWKSGRAPDLITVPAQLVTESDAPLSHEVVAGRVVVIGSSYAESRDLYQTPLKLMPGSLIIVNAIKSLAAFGQISQPPAAVKWTVQLLLLIGTALAFTRWDSLLGSLVTSCGIFLLLLPLSFYFFKFGIWVDFAVPLLGMNVYQIIVDYEKKNKTSAASPRAPSDRPRTDGKLE